MTGKTKIKMTGDSQHNDWKVGEVGYIECACRGANDAPYLVVVIGSKVVMCPTYAVEVIED